jgi:hypothetical protein
LALASACINAVLRAPQRLPAMTDRHAKPIKILIRQLSEDIQIDVVFGKALRVLGHAE